VTASDKENSKQPPSTATAAPAGTPLPAKPAAEQQPAAAAAAAPNKAHAVLGSSSAAAQQLAGSSKPSAQQHAVAAAVEEATPLPSKVIIAAPVPGTALDHGGGAGDAIIGRRIKVFWPKDRAWYEGTIQAYKDSKHRGEQLQGPLQAGRARQAASNGFGQASRVDLVQLDIKSNASASLLSCTVTCLDCVDLRPGLCLQQWPQRTMACGHTTACVLA
jgi:hypothetical protein